MGQTTDNLSEYSQNIDESKHRQEVEFDDLSESEIIQASKQIAKELSEQLFPNRNFSIYQSIDKKSGKVIIAIYLEATGVIYRDEFTPSIIREINTTYWHSKNLSEFNVYLKSIVERYFLEGPIGISVRNLSGYKLID